MSTNKSHYIISNLQPRDFSKGLKNEFETAVVNEPLVFEPLKFYCIWVCSSFPFGFENGMCDLIVLVPGHCLSFYLKLHTCIYAVA